MNRPCIKEQLEQRELRIDASSLRRKILVDAREQWSSAPSARYFSWSSVAPIAASVAILFLCLAGNYWERAMMRGSLTVRPAVPAEELIDSDLCEELGPSVCRLFVIRQRIAAERQLKAIPQIRSFPIS